ncbi:hypothetical protein [Spiroplasma sp. ChiS]|uniref:hypothetical protein n=1 Tax=Spiroplasma sp. ChiS TaxID=2099885 RepID=UPI001F37E5E0|nr:hypothetical protein [Spiroplasma sp. ChiS]
MLNNLSKKMKFIWLGILSGVLSIFLILGIGLTVPGMDLESLKFINSIFKNPNSTSISAWKVCNKW